MVVGLTHTLGVMVEQIAELESEIARALGAHPDGAIFHAFFRSPEADLRRDAALRDRRLPRALSAS